MSKCKDNGPSKGKCLTRRSFFLRSGAVVGGTVLLTNIPGLDGKALAAEVVGYPRKLIGNMARLRANEPVSFTYPDDGTNSSSVLVKLGTPAGGGIGGDADVVAFNTLCTHMGGPLDGSYKSDEQVLGPCPLHQTTFDLTRHGIVISGHGTESLPQILLELDGDDIYAVGMIGLIYGRYDNLES